jgi:hypothetical protein
MDLLQ